MSRLPSGIWLLSGMHTHITTETCYGVVHTVGVTHTVDVVSVVNTLGVVDTISVVHTVGVIAHCRGCAHCHFQCCAVSCTLSVLRTLSLSVLCRVVYTLGVAHTVTFSVVQGRVHSWCSAHCRCHARTLSLRAQ